MMLNKKELEEDKRFKPVFILGAARSGTKLLRDMIASSYYCYHIPYDINYIWRFGNEDCSHDAILPDSCDIRTIKHIKKQLPKLARIKSNASGCYLIEKTVSNTLRVELLKHIYPNAIFIHIIRDGRDVVESSFRMWNEEPDLSYLIKKLKYFPISNVKYATWYFKNMFIKNNNKQRVWGPRYPGIYYDLDNYSVIEVCAKQWKECVNYAQRGLSSVSDKNKKNIYFEDLVSSVDRIKEICDFLELPDKQRVIDYYNHNVRADVIGKWKEAGDEEDMQKAIKIINPLLKELGYVN